MDFGDIHFPAPHLGSFGTETGEIGTKKVKSKWRLGLNASKQVTFQSHRRVHCII